MATGSAARRSVVAIFLTFAFAYFFSALLRAVTATLAPVFSVELGLGSADLGSLAGAVVVAFSAAPAMAQSAWLLGERATEEGHVDGRPFRTVEPPFDLRWPLVPGEHTFQARVPFTAARSRAGTVIVE